MPHPWTGAAIVSSAADLFLLTWSGGYECACGSEGEKQPAPAEFSTGSEIFLFYFRAHGKECRSDDHSEKYQCKDKIGLTIGGVSFWRLWPSLSNNVPGCANVDIPLLEWGKQLKLYEH